MGIGFQWLASFLFVSLYLHVVFKYSLRLLSKNSVVGFFRVIATNPLTQFLIPFFTQKLYFEVAILNSPLTFSSLLKVYTHPSNDSWVLS